MSEFEPSETVYERPDGGRVRNWLLLTGNRNVLAGVLTVGLFLVLVGGGWVNVVPLRTVIQTGTHVERLFQAFIGSLITGITLVVTLNQLVLSRELGPLGDQRERMAGSLSFREEIEDLSGSVAPPDPASFLAVFMAQSKERADRLREATATDADEALRDRAETLADRIHAHADEVESRLSDARFGRFDVLRTVLDYDYSWNTYALRRLRSEHDDSLSEAERAAFDDLVEVLQLFGPAREHFKTLYFRWELVNFSRGILYTGIPALAVSMLGLLYIDPNSFAGTTAGVDTIVVVVSAAAAVATTPFFLLAAYIVRLGTVAQRTLAIGPFVLREAERPDDVDLGGSR
ncbi:hypothetical protein [Halomarina ordinaria]|uniref:DUF4239 domain-containing protein n=1 Tax=Halomarina ordinaria TaxID=3033939 RepID=A0ABD5UA79_9EURY|nr:hypothetical protein [Halomarina sp. PSRA2]